MSMDDNDGQMIFGDIGGLKLPDICVTGEEKPRKNLIQETCPDRGSNPGPLRDKRACYHLLHSGGLGSLKIVEAFPFCICQMLKKVKVKKYTVESAPYKVFKWHRNLHMT